MGCRWSAAVWGVFLGGVRFLPNGAGALARAGTEHGQNGGQEHQTVQATQDYDREEHAEVVDAEDLRVGER